MVERSVIATGEQNRKDRVYFEQGNDKFRLGQYQGAIADYDQALRLNPDYAAVYYICGLAKHTLGQHQAAIADMKTALKLAQEAGDSALITEIERQI